MKPQDLATRATTAFNARDEAALRALWTEDFHFVGPDGESRGADAMIAREQGLWQPFPDVQASIETVCFGDDVVAMETTMTGTHTGPLTLADGELPPTGRAITLSFGVHVWFRDGLACRERVFYDRSLLLRQLGLG